VKFEDYYKTLGVERGASEDEIRRAYRKLARKYHPDVNKDAGASEQFNKATEAYDVLSNPEKRKKYDELGANWKAGDDFRPPPGYEHFARGAGGGAGAGPSGGFSFSGDNLGDILGQMFGARAAGRSGPDPYSEMFAGGGPYGRRGASQARGNGAPPTPETEAPITLEDAFHGASRRLSLRTSEHGPERVIDLKIPRGATDGARVRLKGQGPGGQDLILKLRLQPHPRFKAEGRNLVTDLPLSPWEAALGVQAAVQTLDGEVTLTVPPGVQSGQRLRLKGRGLPRASKAGAEVGEPGDLFARVKIVVPTKLSDEERKLFEQLRDASSFSPRSA